MSGGNSAKNKSRSSKRQEGWEEAGGEFYQELYPGNTEQDLFDNLQTTDAAKLATLLPSKQVRNSKWALFYIEYISTQMSNVKIAPKIKKIKCPW